MKKIRSWLVSLGLFEGRDRADGTDTSRYNGEVDATSLMDSSESGDPDYPAKNTGINLWEDPFNGAAVSVPIEDSLDLHTYPPDETGEVLDAYLEAARDAGHRRVRIIHGKGRGVQRQIVHSCLGRNCYVDRFQNASAEEGGWGATIVFLKPC